MQRKRLYTAIAFLLDLAGLTLGMIAFTTTWWRTNAASSERFGLFHVCEGSLCVEGVPPEDEPFLQATRAFMLAGCSLLLIDLVVLGLLYSKRGLDSFPRVAFVMFIVSGVFLIIACSVYTGETRFKAESLNLRFGYSLWLGWAAAIISLVSSPFAYFARASYGNRPQKGMRQSFRAGTSGSIDYGSL